MYHIPILLGLQAAKWYFTRPDKPDVGSKEDIRQLHEIVKALTQDTENLTAALQQQQEQIELLKRQIGGAFLLLLPLLITVIYLAATHH
jgi:hypothetical protein